MTRRPTAAVLALAFLAGCGGSPDDARPPEEGGPAAAQHTISPAEEVISRAQRIDESLPFGAAEARTVDMPGEPERAVRLWRRAGQPVRLLATQPDERGRMIEHTDFYFDQGELFFVRDPAVLFVFDEGRLAVMLDDQLDTLATTPQELASYEAQLRELAAALIATFDTD